MLESKGRTGWVSLQSLAGLVTTALGLYGAQHGTDGENMESSGRRKLCQMALSFRYFSDLLICSKYLSSLHSLIPSQLLWHQPSGTGTVE